MGYVAFNSNPMNKRVGDCVIRAISFATDKTWDDIFFDLLMKSYEMKDMPSSNNVWGAYLRDIGYKRHIIPDTCPDCYKVRDFVSEHPKGTYILATGSHVIAVKDGKYYDTWDSGQEIPVYYFEKEVDNEPV